MFCSSCGGQNEKGTKFCTHCGHNFAQPVTPPQEYVPPLGYQRKQESELFSFKELLVPSKISIVWLVGSVAILAWTFFAFLSSLLMPNFLGGLTVTFHGVLTAFKSILSGAIGLIVFRLACELMVIISKKD